MLVLFAFGFYCDLFFTNSFPSSIWNNVNQCQSLHCVLEHSEFVVKTSKREPNTVVSLTFNYIIQILKTYQTENGASHTTQSSFLTMEE
jgi:hypothetical protein